MDVPFLTDPNAIAGRTFSPANSLDLATLQTAITNQLKSSFAGTPIAVHAFPNQPPDEWWENQAAIGFVLVAYNRAKYSPPQATSSMVQERTADFEIKLIARQVAWGDFTSKGFFQAMLAVVQASLTGFRAPGWRNAYFTEEGFSSQDPQGAIWVYSMSYRVITFLIKQPNPQVEAALALLKEVQYIEDGGLTPVPAAPAVYAFNESGILQLPAQNVTAVTVTNLPTGTPYVEGTDFSVQQAQGTLTALAGGSISAGESVRVAYSAGDVVTANEQGGPAPFFPSN